MFYFDDITNENNAGHNLKWPYIPDYPYRMLIIGGFGSGKTNALLNLIREQENDELMDMTYLYAKDINEPKYQLLIKKHKDAGIKHLSDPKAFIEYSNTMDNVYNDFNNFNLKRSRKILIVFNDMIVDTDANKNFQDIIKELFFRRRKLNISIVFITQPFFFCSK